MSRQYAAKAVLLAGGLAIGLGSAAPVEANSPAQILLPSFAPLVEAVKPGVVTVVTTIGARSGSGSAPGGWDLEEFMERLETASTASQGRRLRRNKDFLRPELGLTLSSAKAFEGAVVRAVEPGTAAAATGLRPGDLIVSLDQEPVASPSDLTEMIAAAQDAGADTVQLMVESKGRRTVVILEIADA